jgi:Lrp/AsnC family leucine-responsive transcriptional regulator
VLDEVDRRLVDALRANARASYAELGRLVNMSGPGVADRIARLEVTGVITGYHAAVAPAALGLDVTALVGIYQRDDVDEEAVVRALAELPEVEDCWHVAGDENFVVKVRAADVAALGRTLGSLLAIEGVARTRTTLVLSARWEARVPRPGD